MLRRSLCTALVATFTALSLSATDVRAGGAPVDIVPDQLIVILLPGEDIEAVNATWGTTTLEAVPAADLYLLEAANAPDLELLAAEMETDPRIDSVGLNVIEDTPEAVRQMVLGAVGGTYADFEDQELTNRIGLDAAHTQARGTGVLVAVLDTGIDMDHEVFAGRISPLALDLVDGDSHPDEENNRIDDDGDGAVDEGHGHGSMVAGIVALTAPDATILPIRVLDDEGRGESWRVLAGIRYAREVGADVLNMSFGVPEKISPVRYVLRDLYDEGFVLVAGAGNENRAEPIYFPGEIDEVMLVTALDSNDVKADFADYNEMTDVAAPGTGVRSAYPGGGWALGSGCSFATPFVSGEAALVLSAFPGSSPGSVRQRIRSAVDPIYQLPGNGPFAANMELGTGRIFLPYAVDGAVAVGEETPPAAGDWLLRLAPNPARGAVRIQVAAGASSRPFDLTVYDASGRRVRAMDGVSGHTVTWDGRGAGGRELPAGVYYVRVTRGGRELGSSSVRVLR